MVESFPAGMSVGLVPMSGKPVHQAHWTLIEMAARENDHVILYVSTSDRKRRGQTPILGSDMQEVWRRYLEPALPDNVDVVYGGSPVANVYKQVGEESRRMREGDDDVARYVVYAGEDDMPKNFPQRNFEKYAPELIEVDLLDRRSKPVDRASDVTGTKMRSHIAQGEREQFEAMLPAPLSGEDRGAIWALLSSTASDDK